MLVQKSNQKLTATKANFENISLKDLYFSSRFNLVVKNKIW